MNLVVSARSGCTRAALVGALVMAPASLAAAGLVVEPPTLLTHYRCYTCHSDREARVGPALREIAAFYRGRQDAVSKIAADIRRGIKGGGPWHMPPHPEVSPEEARVMARYIMSLEPREAAAQSVNNPGTVARADKE